MKSISSISVAAKCIKHRGHKEAIGAEARVLLRKKKRKKRKKKIAAARATLKGFPFVRSPRQEGNEPHPLAAYEGCEGGDDVEFPTPATV